MIRQLVNKLFGRSHPVGEDVPVESVFAPESDRTTFVHRGAMSHEVLQELQNRIAYGIVNPAYFEQALTHRSYLQVADESSMPSNERLEFLGDSILNMLIGEFLFHRYSDIQEGELTKLRSRLVNRKALTICARMVQLESAILLNTSAIQSLEQGNDSLLADAFEAVVAAIYLDSGCSLIPVKKFLARTLLTPDTIEKVLYIDENFKSLLLEHVQAQGLGAPRYIVVREEGPDHERVFTVQVLVANDPLGEGRGRSKKEAEQAAAAEAVEKVKVQIEG